MALLLYFAEAYDDARVELERVEQVRAAAAACLPALTRLAGCLAAWLPGWLAAWLAGWLAGCVPAGLLAQAALAAAHQARAGALAGSAAAHQGFAAASHDCHALADPGACVQAAAAEPEGVQTFTADELGRMGLLRDRIALQRAFHAGAAASAE